MKKLLFYVTFVLLLLSLCTVFFACKKGDELTHDMQLDETLTVKASCVKDGSETYKCEDCEHQVTITIKSHGHCYGVPEVVLPTCTEEGGITYTCVLCEERTFELLDQLGHSFASPDNMVPPTCGTQGSLTYECSRCGAPGNTLLEPSDHEYEDVVIAPTCKDEGYTLPTCACGETQAAHTPVAATGVHHYAFVSQTQVACGELSVLTYRCIYEGCDETVTEELLIEHELGNNGKCQKTDCTYDICEALAIEEEKSIALSAGTAVYLKLELAGGIYDVRFTPAQGCTLEIFLADDTPVSLNPNGELPVSQLATYYFKLSGASADTACTLRVSGVA